MAKRKFRTANRWDVGRYAFEIPDRDPMDERIPLDGMEAAYYYTRQAHGRRLGRCVALVHPDGAREIHRMRSGRYLGRVMYDQNGVGQEEGQRDWLEDGDL